MLNSFAWKDDEHSHCRMTMLEFVNSRLWLEREGVEVYEAENGRKGIELQRKTPVDLLICDLIMPIQEGIESITQFNKEFPEICIIAISGGGKISPDSYLSVAEHLGAWRAFAKPVDMTSLIRTIKEWQRARGRM